jgi:hypothetical protein
MAKKRGNVWDRIRDAYRLHRAVEALETPDRVCSLMLPLGHWRHFDSNCSTQAGHRLSDGTAELAIEWLAPAIPH